MSKHALLQAVRAAAETIEGTGNASFLAAVMPSQTGLLKPQPILEIIERACTTRPVARKLNG